MERSLVASPRSWLMLAAGFIVAIIATPTFADPPTRAARISLVSGSASFSPAGSDEWVQARVNRPIWIGDRVWSGDGRIELQLGGASLRLAPQTSLQVLNFDDRIAQFEVTQGSVALNIRAIDSEDAIEIDTPSFAFVTREAGSYRIDVERDHTAVAARRGVADIYGQDVAYRIDRRERFAFYSPDLRDYDAGPLPPPDAFDRWAAERSRREDRSTSSRYVSPELVGFVDLDSHGEWRTDATHGNVWIPRVAADWAPYRYGNWSWVDPWGWTWVDDAPWGFAPSHYGRWTQLGRSWAWVPGPRNVRPAYSPALVAWVGGDNFSLSVSSGRTRGVGWFPLAPGEVWRPSYEVSRDYFTRVNVANTVVNNTTVVNVYNTRNDVRISNEQYRFRSAPAAVTAVPVETFVQGRPVQLTQAQMNANAAAQANVLLAAPAQPVRQSFIGAAPRSQAKPPAETVQRAVVARTTPAAAVPSLEQRAVLVREGKPVTRESLERGAPPAAQSGTPQRPVTASPAPGQPVPAQPQPPAVAGQPQPPAATGPGQPRANVRVVESEKGAPKPLPEGGSRAARNEGEQGRAARGAPPVQPPQAAQPAPSPPQAAQPGRPQAAQPPSAPPGQAGRPNVAAPQAGGPPQQETGRAPASTPTPPMGSPPGRAPTPAPGRENVAPPATLPPPAAVAPPRSGAPAPAEGLNRAERPSPSQPPSPPPAAKAPATAPAPIPAGRAPVAPPAAQTPGAEPPNFDQLCGKTDASGRRGAEDQGRATRPDERRAQPAAPPSAETNSGATPKPPVAQAPGREARPVPAPTAAPPQSARPATEERRATPAAPAAAPAPAAKAEPSGRAAVPPQAAPPSARPPAEAPAAQPQGNRPERGKDTRSGKDKDKDQDKEKDKDKN